MEKLEDDRERLARPELLESMKGFLEDLIQQADLDLQFSCEMEADGIHVRLKGSDDGLVLADSARLLYAINHLLNQIFFRKSEDGCNFWVDCDVF
jgi:predicted RNA-binding protein Jag